jgi:hypothetical protein
LPIQVQETSRTPNWLDQNGTSPWHIIIKTNRERIFKFVREKKQIIYKGQPIKITAGRNLKSKKGMEWGISGTEWKSFLP